MRRIIGDILRCIRRRFPGRRRDGGDFMSLSTSGKMFMDLRILTIMTGD